MNNNSTASWNVPVCTFADDNTLGPAVANQCRTFDFTLFFEQVFLSLLPSLLLISSGCLRVVGIYHRGAKTLPSRLHGSKLTFAACYASLQLILLVVSALPSVPRTALSLPTSVFSFVGSIVICLLSHFEHTKSIQPSGLLNVYLFFTVLFDAVQLRTLWKIPGLETFASVFSSALALKVALLILEAWEKGSFLAPTYRTTTPEGKSSIYNRSLFWWLNRLFNIGFKKVLAFEDLYSLDHDLSSEVLAIKVQAAWKRAGKGSKHVLLWTILSCLKWPLLAAVLPRLALIGFSYSQPFLINRVISFVGDASAKGYDYNVGYGLIGAAAIIYTGIAISNGRYQHAKFRYMVMIRGTLSSLIFAKTLEIRFSKLEDAAPVTLASTDIDSIVDALQGVHEIWASTIEVIIAMYLLGQKAGVGCIAPVILAVAGAAANSFWVGPQMRKRRPIWNAAIQRRVSLVSSMLRDMKALKMLGLSGCMKALLQDQRNQELEHSKAVRWMIIWMNLFANMMPMFSKAFVLATVALQAQSEGRQSLTAAEAYTMISLLDLVSNPLSLVTAKIPGFMGCIGCFGRIQAYLLEESKNDDRLIEADSRSGLESSSAVELQVMPTKGVTRSAVDLNECSLGYSTDTAAIKDLTSSILRGSVTMIIGPIGSGKTSLLLGLLGEIQSTKGFVRMHTADIAYCQQSAWLPNRTIRDIIIGTLPFEEAWYEKVVFSCGLDVDISRLPEHDHALIGSRGLVLSGGQRQRLALARAVYARKAIVLLDDIFSALDAKTEQVILERLFTKQGLFRQHKMTVIVVTHAVHQLHAADYIIALGKDGHLVEQGSFSELKAKRGYVEALALETRNKQTQEEVEISGTYGSADAQYNSAQPFEPSDNARRMGDLSVYRYYGKHLGLAYLLTFLGLDFARGSCSSLPDLWVQFWTEDKGRNLGMYIAVMFALACSTWCFNFSSLWLMFIRIIPRGGKRLHWVLLSIITAAPLSYFAKTDAGIILNRFSQDMTIIDAQLPIAFLQLSFAISRIVWNGVFICYGAYYLAAFIPFLVGVVYAIQKFYLRTSRQLRLIDLEMRSPLFTHFTETQEGVVTIRAYQWQEKFYDQFLQKLDASQRPYYLLFMIQQWLGFCLALVVASIAILLVAFATQFKHQSSGPAIGIALLNVIDFSSSLTELISFWTQLETSIGAIARLKQLEIDVKPEDLPNECGTPPDSWPDIGAVKYDNISASYNDDAPVVLHNINLSIKPGEKIGICGRTGSGKSTLISLLFRLLPTRTGTITIDNMDLSTIPRQKLREAVIAIPQEPYILSGSVRFNAAPHSAPFLDATPEPGFTNASDSMSDRSIIAALEKVDLWSLVAARGGLSIPISDVGLSHGQKQLFCLARAILRKETSKILVLDEATSSVDKRTDEMMLKLIDEEFAEHTIISVAHRLSSLVGCDRVVVMNEGRIVEVGDPRTLMEKDGGWWRELWEVQN